MSFLDKLKAGLGKTKSNINEKFNNVFSTFRKVNEELLDILKDNNVNRLSIGIQSFNEEKLKFMERNHTFDDASKKIKLARQNGVDNIKGKVVVVWKVYIYIFLFVKIFVVTVTFVSFYIMVHG